MPDKVEQTELPQAFAALGVRLSILRALAEAKFTVPSDIQNLLIPKALAGYDILGQARTGTGKTAAFAIPILQKADKGTPTQAIILVPTRELAVQVETEVKRLAEYTPIRSVAVYGGQKIAAQMKFLKNHPEVLVGTPGRVIDLLDRGIIRFDNIRFVVLDEVDRMLDIGFRDDIRNILSRIKGVRQNLEQRSKGAERPSPGAPLPPSPGTPGESTGESLPSPQPESEILGPPPEPSVQTIFVSATISDEVEKLARQYTREPVAKLIASGSDEKPTVAEVQQFYLSAQPWDKYRLLRMLLLRENPDLAIVFCKTKHGARKLAKKLHADGIECREIHGDLIQSKRERVMKSFRTGKFDVLVATDLASRGIDVADISHIVNFDIPEDPEVYVHRVGRTARMGAAGKAFTIVSRDQGDQLTNVEALINMVIPQATIEGFEPTPPPADWIDVMPGDAPAGPREAVPSRYERAYSPIGSAGGGAASPAVALPPPTRTLGSKIPINRRHRRRR